MPVPLKAMTLGLIWVRSRRRAGDAASVEVETTLITAQLVAGAAGVALPTGIVHTVASRDRISIARLRGAFLKHHEHVVASSVATISRYASAIQRLLHKAAAASLTSVLTFDVAGFIKHLRGVRINPYGYPAPPNARCGTKASSTSSKSLAAFITSGSGTTSCHPTRSTPLPCSSSVIYGSATRNRSLCSAPGRRPASSRLVTTGSSACSLPRLSSARVRGELVHTVIEDLYFRPAGCTSLASRISVGRSRPASSAMYRCLRKELIG